MDEKLFRKKSMARVTSPEQLTDYIRVSNPGTWMLLAAIVVLLAGVCVWGVFGKMDTKLAVVAVSDNGVMTCYVKEADIASVKEGMTVLCGEERYTVLGMAAVPFAADSSIGAYALHVGNLQIGEWVYALTLDKSPADGVYRAEIVIDSVAPMSFVFQ